MFREFNESLGADWSILKYPMHDSFNRYFRDLCHIYKAYKAFYAYDYNGTSFRWIDADNYKQSIYIYTRYDEDYCFLIILNMKPISYTNFRVGVPYRGVYTELINSEKDIYNGCNMCNFKPVRSHKIKAHGLPNSITIDLAPYAGVMFSVKAKKKVPIFEDPDVVKKPVRKAKAA